MILWEVMHSRVLLPSYTYILRFVFVPLEKIAHKRKHFEEKLNLHSHVFGFWIVAFSLSLALWVPLFFSYPLTFHSFIHSHSVAEWKKFVQSEAKQATWLQRMLIVRKSIKASLSLAHSYTFSSPCTSVMVSTFSLSSLVHLIYCFPVESHSSSMFMWNFSSLSILFANLLLSFSSIRRWWWKIDIESHSSIWISFTLSSSTNIRRRHLIPIPPFSIHILC